MTCITGLSLQLWVTLANKVAVRTLGANHTQGIGKIHIHWPDATPLQMLPLAWEVHIKAC